MRTEKDWSNYLIYGTPLPPLLDDEVPMPFVSHTEAPEMAFRPKAARCLVCGDTHSPDDLGCDESDIYEKE